MSRRILEHEAGRAPDAVGAALALEEACGRLKEDLIDMLGTGGISALFRRALHLAQREQPVLATVSIRGEPAACFLGLGESLHSSTDEAATVAAATVLTHVLTLLVMLLGEELGMKPICKLWPQAAIVREIDE